MREIVSLFFCLHKPKERRKMKKEQDFVENNKFRLKCVNLEPCQGFIMKCFEEIINCYKRLKAAILRKTPPLMFRNVLNTPLLIV